MKEPTLLQQSAAWAVVIVLGLGLAFAAAQVGIFIILMFQTGSRLLPLATNPTMVPTVMRSPRMQGLPPMTAGSWLIRGNALGQA